MSFNRTQRVGVSRSRASGRGSILLLTLCVAIAFFFLAPGHFARARAQDHATDVHTPGNDPRLSMALERAGANRAEIETFLSSYPESSDRRTAAEFLVRNMPTVDLAWLRAGELTTNLAYAFRAREELPWGDDVPFNLFLHYVLPHRATQERFEPWRKQLFDQIAPVIKDCTNMTEAALAVNRWCGQRVGFKQTEFRDQNAMATLRSGIGRCEEMMIVCIDAMRAVGIPARACSAPWWVVNDNNHAWVEVWADGDWYYLGGCEPAGRLDQAWFSGAAQRAGTVISQMYGTADDHPTGETVCRTMDDMAYINSTAVYAMTGEVEITVRNESGQPVEDCPVAVSVFNFGALRPLNIQHTDKDGKTTFVVGLGEYFYSAGNEQGRAHAIVETAPSERQEVELELIPGDAPEKSFWLRYPTVPEARRWAAKRAKAAKGEVPVNVRPDLAEPDALDLFEAGRLSRLDSVLGSLSEQARTEWKDILTDARANWRPIADAIVDLSSTPYLSDALELMKRTSKVDRLEITSETILDQVKNAAEMRRDATSDDRFYKLVLDARIGYEHTGPWRGEMVEAVRSCNDDDAKAVAKNILGWMDRNLSLEDRNNRLGPTMNPGQVLRAGRGSENELAIFAVGALRSLGVPARLTSVGSEVEFLDKDLWYAFKPTDPDSLRRVSAGEEEPATGVVVAAEDDAAEKRATIQLSLMRDGQPIEGNFYGFDVATFRNGAWAPLRDYDMQTVDGVREITLPAGEYLVTAGVRNANGDPYVHTKLVSLDEGDVNAIAWSLDLPEDAGMFQFPVARKIEDVPEVVLHDRGAGTTFDLNAMSDEAPLLLYFFRMDDEPSIRMLPLVNDALPTLQESGVRAIGIALPSAVDQSIKSFLTDHPAKFPVVEASNDVAEAFGLETTQPLGLVRPMPAVVLLQRGGTVLVWVEDLNLDLEQILRNAARMVN